MVISLSPGFHFLSPGFWSQNNILKTIMQIRLISFIYYIPWNRVTLDNFFKLFIFFSSIPLLPWCFWKKNILPFVHAFEIRVYCYTHMTCCKIIKYWQVWKFFLGGDFGRSKNIYILKIWPHLLLQSDLLTLQIVFVCVLTLQISCKFQFPWNFSFSLALGWLWTL